MSDTLCVNFNVDINITRKTLVTNFFSKEQKNFSVFKRIKEGIKEIEYYNWITFSGTISFDELDSREPETTMGLIEEKKVLEEKAPSGEETAWDSKFQYLLALLGWAVGLGNFEVLKSLESIRV